ncbi:MAG: hypothetical protein GXY03_09525 [Solirubrobacterales bacterium]|nr:hypothetical protein [Solirubrobacterales bacterium]
MGKTEDKELYERLRTSGVRKKVARQLSDLPSEAESGAKVPKPQREAVERLEEAVSELRGHVAHGDRRAAGRKAARSRKAKAEKRSAAGRKAARRRAKA